VSGWPCAQALVPRPMMTCRKTEIMIGNSHRRKLLMGSPEFLGSDTALTSYLYQCDCHKTFTGDNQVMMLRQSVKSLKEKYGESMAK
jgi:hypothetical protein